MILSPNIRTALTAATLAVASMTGAQEPLSQEITVEREVVPEPRDVARLNFTPSVALPSVAAPRLAYSQRPVNVSIAPAITPAGAVAWADSLATSPWRGYVSGGLFPALFNADLSAGYKLLDTDRTRLTGALQYNGSTYRGDYPDRGYGRDYVRRHGATIALSLHQAVGRKSFVDAGVDLGVERYTMPGSELRLAPQMMRRLGLQALLTSSVNEIDYSAGVGYSHFGFNNTIITDRGDREAYAPVRENTFTVNGHVAMPFSGRSRIGLRACFDVVSNTRHATAEFDFANNAYQFAAAGGYTHGLVTLTPYYNLRSHEVSLNIGARINFSFNAGKAFHIAPDVSATWRPAAIFALFAKAGGGEHQNTLQDLFSEVPAAATMMAYSNSHIPLTLDAGITIGSWRGAWLQAQVGYARANSWLMPVSDTHAITLFRPVDMRGLHWQVSAGYSYKSLASITVRYEGTQQGYDRGYYLWRDRADCVVGAELTVKPLKPLSVTLGYELRAGRRMMNSVTDWTRTTDGVHPLTYRADHPLGSISDLSLSGTWQYDSRLSFFASLENILCKKYRLAGMLPGQGFHGLLGASYKF